MSANDKSAWVLRMTPAEINALCEGSMISHLGITFTEVGDDFVRATMPVDRRTVQPAGLLHGGASVALAETVGSLAAIMSADPETTQDCVGLEIKANHLRPVTSGHVTATARPVRLGNTTQVHQIHIHDDNDDLICISILTVAVRRK